MGAKYSEYKQDVFDVEALYFSSLGARFVPDTRLVLWLMLGAEQGNPEDWKIVFRVI